MTKPPRKNASNTRGRPFEPGNPGKPAGARHKVTRAVEELLDGQAEALTQRAIEAALGGDVTALRICLDRIAPAPKERSISIAAPSINTAADVPSALAAVFAAVASGDLTPGEGSAIAGLLDRFRSAYELAEIERRLQALEINSPGAGG